MLRLLTYEMLPWYHKVLFTIVHVSLAALSVMLTVVVAVIFVTLIVDWVRNKFN